MWKTIQDYLGPVPAPVFVLMFVSGVILAFVASAPTTWIERGQRFIARRQRKRLDGGKR